MPEALRNYSIAELELWGLAINFCKPCSPIEKV